MSENSEEYQINVTPEKGVVTILHGKALDPKPPVPLDISGTIETPSEFWGKRKSDFEVNACYVERDSDSITLILNENDPLLKGKVSGRIKMSDECSRFGINSENLHDNKGLARLIKANEFLFVNREVWLKVYNSLVDFEANVSLAIVDKQKANGDREKALNITVTKGVATSFQLQTRIYGRERVIFTVDLNAEVLGHKVEFYLDSSELAVKMSEAKDNMLDDCVKCFLDDGLVVIDK